jgi:hypothetical protein
MACVIILSVRAEWSQQLIGSTAKLSLMKIFLKIVCKMPIQWARNRFTRKWVLEILLKTLFSPNFLSG